MVKCAKKLINLLTKWVNVLKGCLHQSGKSFGPCVCARITSIFSFPTHTRAHFARQITKDYKKISMWLQNRDKMKYRTHYAIFKIAAYVQIAKLYGLVHYAACSFCSYINGLWSALVGEYSLSGCFMRSWLVWALRECECVWRSFVFVSVDVKYIIHYKRMCKFICSL